MNATSQGKACMNATSQVYYECSPGTTGKLKGKVNRLKINKKVAKMLRKICTYTTYYSLPLYPTYIVDLLHSSVLNSKLHLPTTSLKSTMTSLLAVLLTVVSIVTWVLCVTATVAVLVLILLLMYRQTQIKNVSSYSLVCALNTT